MRALLLLSWFASARRGFRGVWVGDKLVFPSSEASLLEGQPGLNTSGSRRDAWPGGYDFTWLAPFARKVTLPLEAAVRAAGPLTLLRALDLCKAVELLSAGRGDLRVHVIGTNSHLEPLMNWREILTGRSELVRKFGLEGIAARVSKLRISLLFNSYGHYNATAAHDLRAYSSRTDEWYSERFHVGKYEDALRDERTPDLVFGLNAGFASDAELFWPALTALRAKGVPIVATGYGENCEGFGVKRVVGGFRHMNRAGRVICPVPTESAEPDPAEPDLAEPDLAEPKCDNVPAAGCGDTGGTALMATWVGYSLREAENPFMYCDYPEKQDCNSNARLYVLTPDTEVLKAREPPADLLLAVLRAEVQCVQPRLRPCFSRAVDKRDFVRNSHEPDVVDAIAERCEAELRGHRTFRSARPSE